MIKRYVLVGPTNVLTGKTNFIFKINFKGPYRYTIKYKHLNKKSIYIF